MQQTSKLPSELPSEQPRQLKQKKKVLQIDPALWNNLVACKNAKEKALGLNKITWEQFLIFLIQTMNAKLESERPKTQAEKLELQKVAIEQKKAELIKERGY